MATATLRWPDLKPGEEIRRYLGDDTALVQEPSGKQGVIESNLPLRGHTPDGESQPVDLSLVDVGASLAPKSAAAQVRIPSHAGDELRGW